MTIFDAGYRAYHNGESSAPWLNGLVREASGNGRPPQS